MKQNRRIVRELGKQIRALRESRGWTQEELAADAEADLSHLGKIERGQILNPSIQLLMRIAKTLGAEFRAEIK